MARQVKHNIEGCWYHITARGMGRREIYLEDRDLERFTELPQGLVERCGIVLHAYVLMDNHNHLLVATPHANASRALRWLNVSCAAWFNAQHTAGRAPYSSSATRASQSTARAHGLWRRVGTGKSKEDGKVEYRRYLEDCLRQGVEEGAFARITSAVAIGGADFVERLRRKVPPSARCDTNARAWRRLLPFGEVVKAVEAVKGEEWRSFADRRGDYGRDLALYVARMNCGLSIPERAALAGTEPTAASKAIQRMRKRLSGDRKLKSGLRRVSDEIGVQGK